MGPEERLRQFRSRGECVGKSLKMILPLGDWNFLSATGHITLCEGSGIGLPLAQNLAVKILVVRLRVFIE